MVSLFDKASQTQKSPNKIMSPKHQEFLKRIKKTLYYGPSNPNRMISAPLAQHVANYFNQTHKNYDLNILNLTAVSKIRQQTPTTMILSLIYLERLLKSDPNYCRLISPSELFLVTLMVSTKFYSDYDETEVFANNYAYEGDVSLERLKQLEISFLNAIQWNLLVSEHEFYEKLKTVEKLLALKEGLARNYFTYTEIDRLMPTIEIAKQIFNYTTVLMFSYVCSIMTIALSSIILANIPILSTPSTSPRTTIELKANENVTATMLPTATDVNVMLISNEENIDQTECTFDESILIVDSRNFNFTIDFELFNNFEWQVKRNYQEPAKFDFGMLQKYNPVPPMVF